MKTIALMLVVLTPWATPAVADQELYREVSYDWARVIRVEPVIETVDVNVPVQECRDREIRTEYDGGHRNVTGSTIAGGVIGGAVGGLLGRGRARPFTAIGGALVGSVIGGTSVERANERGGYADVRNVRECRWINHVRTEERTEGYNVDYEYRGGIYRTRLPYRPEGRIRVRVTVDPMAP